MLTIGRPYESLYTAVKPRPYFEHACGSERDPFGYSAVTAETLVLLDIVSGREVPQLSH